MSEVVRFRKRTACLHHWLIDFRNIVRCKYCGAVKDFGALLRKRKESLYQRCDECHGNYLIVFECKGEKKRCGRCKGRFDREEGRK